MNPALYVSNLCFGYENEQILFDISFSVETGQCIGIVGPNGGGKSTLLKLLLGLVQPWKGTIEIQGKPLPNLDMAYVPQSITHDKTFPITCLEVVLGGKARNLSLLGKYSTIDIEAAYQYLQQFEVEHLAKTPFGSLSRGQAQRILIARALVSSPSILLLDEPTSCTDPQAEQHIIETIRQLKGSMTILMVTHHIDTISPFVEKILCVHKTATLVQPEELCKHITLGLYHNPILQVEL